MPRQSITLTKQNDTWLKCHVEEKADIYFFGLYDTFNEIAKNPYLYQSIDEIRPGYRRCSYHTDSIYYRFNNSTIEIMAILGSQEVGGWL